jgi:hypothetical protein
MSVRRFISVSVPTELTYALGLLAQRSVINMISKNSLNGDDLGNKMFNRLNINLNNNPTMELEKETYLDIQRRIRNEAKVCELSSSASGTGGDDDDSINWGDDDDDGYEEDNEENRVKSPKTSHPLGVEATNLPNYNFVAKICPVLDNKEEDLYSQTGEEIVVDQSTMVSSSVDVYDKIVEEMDCVLKMTPELVGEIDRDRKMWHTNEPIKQTWGFDST